MAVTVTNYDTVNGKIRTKWTGERPGSQAVFHDPLGSVVGIYEDGWLKADRVYDASGETRAEWNDVGTFGWVGGYGYRETRREWVSHYVRARHYSYMTGGWTSVDPLWPSEMAYGYVEGTVMQSTDNFGTQHIKCPPGREPVYSGPPGGASDPAYWHCLYPPPPPASRPTNPAKRSNPFKDCFKVFRSITFEDNLCETCVEAAKLLAGKASEAYVKQLVKQGFSNGFAGAGAINAVAHCEAACEAARKCGFKCASDYLQHSENTDGGIIYELDGWWGRLNMDEHNNNMGLMLGLFPGDCLSGCVSFYNDGKLRSKSDVGKALPEPPGRRRNTWNKGIPMIGMPRPSSGPIRPNPISVRNTPMPGAVDPVTGFVY